MKFDRSRHTSLHRWLRGHARSRRVPGVLTRRGGEGDGHRRERVVAVVRGRPQARRHDDIHRGVEAAGHHQPRRADRPRVLREGARERLAHERARRRKSRACRKPARRPIRLHLYGGDLRREAGCIHGLRCAQSARLLRQEQGVRRGVGAAVRAEAVRVPCRDG